MELGGLVPVGATTAPITVTTAAGTATSASDFTVTVAPKAAPIKPMISSFKPTSGKPGTLVTITGNGFLKLTSVKFGGVQAKATQVFAGSTTKFSVKVPAGAKSGKITVTTPLGTGASAAR
jgi:hypothetical protein